MGLPLRPADVAVRVLLFVPAVLPSVQETTWAIPLPFVATGVVGLTVPPPVATANVTAVPSTAFVARSRTSTDGAIATAVPAAADCPSPALIEIVVALPC